MHRSWRGLPDRRDRAVIQSAARACRRTTRERGGELWDRDRSSDPREARSNHRFPAWIVLARPEYGRCLVAENVSGPRIGAELATDLLRDGTEVAKHACFRAVLDRGRELGARPHRADEVLDVELSQPVIAN